jgi:hypothetical protein
MELFNKIDPFNYFNPKASNAEPIHSVRDM